MANIINLQVLPKDPAIGVTVDDIREAMLALHKQFPDFFKQPNLNIKVKLNKSNGRL